MREPQQTFYADEEVTLVASGEDETLVAPRFDDEETLVARPVVPLGGEAAEAHAPHAVSTLPVYARRSFAPRRSGALVLVLVSVLVGGVLGGAGLYLYQRQSNDATAAAPTQPETPAATQQQPAPAPTAEVSDAPQPAAPATDAPAEATPAEAATDETPTFASEPETTPAAERDTPSSTGTRKRGKKGEHDDEIERPGRRETRPDSDGPVARADDSDAREARRVDTIFYRPRRAERQAERRAARRARRDSDTDRLRRIFEGTPE